MLNRPFWNAIQFILTQTGKPPMDCQCKLCEPGLTFVCESCHKERAYCRGQDDDYFELCDDCWFEQAGGLERVTATQQNLEDLPHDHN